MCLNCNLLTPLSDAGANALGVECRKYLIVGHNIDFYLGRNQSFF